MADVEEGDERVPQHDGERRLRVDRRQLEFVLTGAGGSPRPSKGGPGRA